MSWSPAMREARRVRGGQADWVDAPVLSYKLVCDPSRPPLTNAMVAARKPHPCFTCDRVIATGEHVRRETRRSQDGRTIEVRYVCALCCSSIQQGGMPWRA